MAVVLRRSFGVACQERPNLGAFAWTLQGDTIVLAAGPFARDAAGARLPMAPSCATTKAWARSMLAAARPAPR